MVCDVSCDVSCDQYLRDLGEDLEWFVGSSLLGLVPVMTASALANIGPLLSDINLNIEL